MNGLKSVEATKKAYKEAGEDTNSRFQEYFNAFDQEAKVGEELVEACRKAFSKGIFIKEILDPELITYRAGYQDRDDGTGGLVDEPVWVNYLDENHSRALADSFADNICIRSLTSDKRKLGQYRMREHNKSGFAELYPQPSVRIEFSVAGIRNNDEFDAERLDGRCYEDENPQSTRYAGSLDALKFRLPTLAELREFGSLAVAKA